MAVGDKTPIKWEDADFKWNIAPSSIDYKVGFEASSFPYTWDDVALVEAAIGAGGGGVMSEDMPWTQFDDEKKLEMTSIDNYGLKPSEEKIKGTRKAATSKKSRLNILRIYRKNNNPKECNIITRDMKYLDKKYNLGKTKNICKKK